jgi:hypothetical protein
MKRIVMGITALAAALLIFACEILLGPDEPVGAGNLVIGFGESGGSGRAAAPTGLDRCDLILTGPGNQKIEARVSAGEDYNAQVALGKWHIEVKAYNDDKVLIGTGSTDVTVKAGKNEARVQMERVEDTPVAVSELDLAGLVTAPVKDQTPNTAAIDASQYTGTIVWQTAEGTPVSGNFAASTVYKALVTLSAKAGFTFSGVAANSFSYSGAESVTNAAGSGGTISVTITFPGTEIGERRVGKE